MNTAKTTPNPATVTIPPPCASSADAPPVLTTVPAEVVLALLPLLVPVDVAVEAAAPEDLPPDAFVEFEEPVVPVVPEPFALLVAVAVAVELSDAPVAAADLEALVFED